MIISKEKASIDRKVQIRLTCTIQKSRNLLAFLKINTCKIVLCFDCLSCNKLTSKCAVTKYRIITMTVCIYALSFLEFSVSELCYNFAIFLNDVAISFVLNS